MEGVYYENKNFTDFYLVLVFFQKIKQNKECEKKGLDMQEIQTQMQIQMKNVFIKDICFQHNGKQTHRWAFLLDIILWIMEKIFTLKKFAVL